MRMTAMNPTTIPRRLVKLPEVMNLCALRATSVYTQEKSGLLPPRVKLTQRSSAWVLDELAVVNAARITGKSDDEIRALVRQLVTARTQPPLTQGAVVLDTGTIRGEQEPAASRHKKTSRKQALPKRSAHGGGYG
jgi:prophage regulatory protein